MQSQSKRTQSLKQVHVYSGSMHDMFWGTEQLVYMQLLNVQLAKHDT